MKHGWLTIRKCEKDHGQNMDKPHRPWQSPVWLGTKWCYVYGGIGIGKESSTMSFCHRLKYRFWPLLAETDEVKKAIEINQPELMNRPPYWVVLHHDNTRPHSSIGLSDFHLFRLLQNSLGSIKLISKEHYEHYLSDFFHQKSQNFYRNGIMALPITWGEVIDQNGTYIL